MWQAISDDIAKLTNCDFRIVKVEQLASGDINQAYKICSQQQCYFVKTNSKQHLDLFSAEALNLDLLNCSDELTVPDVVSYGTTNDRSYLVLEYLDMHPSPLPPLSADFYQLGVALANLHSANQQAEFGWPEDNFIGLTPQVNDYHDNWHEFFCENRLGFQLDLLAQKSVVIDKQDILARCTALLSSHQPIPCLVHGDLWSGNIGFTKTSPCLFDPACYYADREVDIAMSELFGRFDDSFYAGYNDTAPLDSGYQQRKVVYNFYHILNHANMFAGSYLAQVNTFIKQIQKLSSKP
ncbi:fructosamine kinase family protein [Thalassotalea maritima]|uniref:fructosamine kinase family protein n=1 Tax=Thalassotalea maritima TaxID=3242416 RepID=UPI0035290033